MAAANPILTPDRGKAHSVALGVLCALAVVQVGAMVRAVWLAKSKCAAPVVAAQGSTAQADGAPPLPDSVSAAPRLIPPPSVPDASSSAPALPPSSVDFTQSTPVPLTPAPPLDGEMKELIELAQQLRPLGDLKGALDVLRRADLQSPDHPAVLEEMAKTYDMMGLSNQAAATRQKLSSVKATSGAAYDAAQRFGGSFQASSGAGARPIDPSKILRIGTCELIHDRSASRGEKVTLRLPIGSQPGQVIDPAAIDIDVFFFDLVNSAKVEQTKADVPVNTWVDTPVDWKDGQERLDVLYSMPEMTADVIRSIGQRKFHGYIVKLYYQHKLQDTVMEPPSLQSFGAGNAPQTTGNPLLPPAAR